MGKLSKMMLTLLIASLLLVVTTAPALAFDTNIQACWNNCGVGGDGTKLQ